MKPRTIVALVLVLGASAVCVRLGFWQVSRWHEKRAQNTRLRALLAAPSLALGAALPPADSIRDHRVEARGRYDESRQILLSARTHDGSPGVGVVTPLLIDDSLAVLVDRGWLYSPDAATARPQEYPEPGPRVVVGIAEPVSRGVRGGASRSWTSDSTRLVAMRRLDLDSLAGRFPYALAPFVIQQLPGAGVPEKPLRRAPRMLDESMHVSYAIQWFLFAAIILGGSAALAWSRRGGRGAIVERGGPAG
jgi:surfeit locus 1 family protein